MKPETVHKKIGPVVNRPSFLKFFWDQIVALSVDEKSFKINKRIPSKTLSISLKQLFLLHKSDSQSLTIKNNIIGVDHW